MTQIDCCPSRRFNCPIYCPLRQLSSVLPGLSTLRPVSQNAPCQTHACYLLCTLSGVLPLPESRCSAGKQSNQLLQESGNCAVIACADGFFGLLVPGRTVKELSGWVPLCCSYVKKLRVPASSGQLSTFAGDYCSCPFQQPSGGPALPSCVFHQCRFAAPLLNLRPG